MCNQNKRTMTQKKKPTQEQIQEYRTMCKRAVTNEDLKAIEAFAQEYDTFTFVYEENGKMGVKDAAGYVLVPAQFEDIAYTYADSCRGFAVPAIRSGKMALVKPDGQGTLLSEFVYDSVQFQDGFFILVKDGKFGLATAGGHVVVPAEQDEVFLPMNDLVVFTKDGKNGFAMLGTDLITGAEYEAYEMTETDYLQVIKDGETGYIDADGRFTTDEDERYFNAAFD